MSAQNNLHDLRRIISSNTLDTSFLNCSGIIVIADQLLDKDNDPNLGMLVTELARRTNDGNIKPCVIVSHDYQMLHRYFDDETATRLYIADICPGNEVISVSINDTCTKTMTEIKKAYALSNYTPIVFIDRFEHLIAQVNWKNAYNFISDLTRRAQASGGLVIVGIDPSAVESSHEYSIIRSMAQRCIDTGVSDPTANNLRKFGLDKIVDLFKKYDPALTARRDIADRAAITTNGHFGDLEGHLNYHLKLPPTFGQPPENSIMSMLPKGLRNPKQK